MLKFDNINKIYFFPLGNLISKIDPEEVVILEGILKLLNHCWIGFWLKILFIQHYLRCQGYSCE